MTTYTSQMLFLGNFADMDTYETDIDAENHTLINGTYSKPALLDVTVEDANSDGVIMDDEAGGNPSEFYEYDAGAGLTQQIIDSTIVYDVAVLLGDGSTINIQGTVLQLQNGDVLLTDYANGGSLDNLAVQSVTLSNPDSYFSGAFASSSVDNSSVVCFTCDTLIETSEGPRAIASLRVGDLVRTLQHGLQPICWIAGVYHPVPGKHAPIEIEPNSLAPDVPKHRLRVSPQHRILVASPIAEKMFGTNEIFVAAKSLLSLPGISQECGTSPLTYWHFACAQHELVLANGAWAETFFPGPMAIEMLDPDQREEVLALMGPMLNEMTLARLNPPMKQQKKFIQRLSKNLPRRRVFEGLSCSTAQPSCGCSKQKRSTQARNL